MTNRALLRQNFLPFSMASQLGFDSENYGSTVVVDGREGTGRQAKRKTSVGMSEENGWGVGGCGGARAQLLR